MRSISSSMCSGSTMAPPPPAPSRLGRFPIRRRHRQPGRLGVENALVSSLGGGVVAPVERLLDAVERKRLRHHGQDAFQAYEFERLRNLGRKLFTTDEAVSEWLSKPDASLGNMAPLDLLDTDLGAQEVENLLRTLAYGHFV